MLSLKQFKSEFPDIHRAVHDEGYKAGFAAGKTVQPQTTPAPTVPENLTPEERHEKMWHEDVELRLEFEGDKESWLAFAKADALGQVHILGRRPKL